MDITILQFYLLKDGRNDEKKILQGTLHVLLPDIGIEVRGIFVSKKKDAWFISLPTRLDDETGIRYPVFSFSDRAKTDDFIRILKEKGREFVESYLFANPQSAQQDAPTLPQRQEQAIPSKTKNIAPEVKKSPSFAMLKPTQYVDLLPLKKKSTKKGAYAAKR